MAETEIVEQPEGAGKITSEYSFLCFFLGGGGKKEKEGSK